MHGNSRHAAPRQAPVAGPARASGSADAERLAGLLEPAVRAIGMDLEGVRVTSAGRRRLLRVVVDADGGVSLDDIERVSRELSAVLDQAAAMGEAPYTLEVSSPGVDRPLTEPRHWRRAAGRLVTAPLAPQEQVSADRSAGQPSVQGRVRQADARGVTLDIEGEARQFSYGELGPGRIQIEFARLDDGPDDGRNDGADEGTDEEEPDGY
jgi:ribosome maturation factor RimP